ncbi:hypothetical protein OSTOST_08224 [Ostertagia ostertagi]
MKRYLALQLERPRSAVDGWRPVASESLDDHNMDFSLLVSILLHSVTTTFGIAANTLLIYLVVNKTPSNLTGYSGLILNLAACDLSACLSALFVQQRIIPDGLGLYYFSHGPCRSFGPMVCYIGYSFMLHCYAHALYSLLFSFSYRFYVLSHCQPRRCVIRAIIALIYIPSFIQFVTFCFASDSEADVKFAIRHKFGYETNSECVSGHLNILSFVTLYTILHMTLPVIPVYITILILRKLIISKLHFEVNISERSRHLQSQLLKVGLM